MFANLAFALIVKLFAFINISCLLACLDFINSSNSFKLIEFPMIFWTKRLTHITEPVPVQRYVFIFSGEIVLISAFANEKVQNVFYSQTLDLWYTSDNNVFGFQCLNQKQNFNRLGFRLTILCSSIISAIKSTGHNL